MEDIFEISDNTSNLVLMSHAFWVESDNFSSERDRGSPETAAVGLLLLVPVGAKPWLSMPIDPPSMLRTQGFVRGFDAATPC